MKYKVEIREIPSHIVYFKNYYIKSIYDFFDLEENKNVLQDLSDKVMAENPTINLTNPESNGFPDYNVILYANGEFKPNNVNVEFCDAVTDFGKDTEDYKFKYVEGFTAVNILHRGSYETLCEAYKFAYEWIKENGYEKVGCPRDSTIDGCWNTANKNEYLTEIQIPVKKILL